MNVITEQNGNTATVTVEGRLDTTTAPQFEAEINSIVDNVNDLVLEFDKLEYISSAGLRVLLATHKTISKKGTMVINGANSDVKDIFEITGFSDILTIN